MVHSFKLVVNDIGSLLNFGYPFYWFTLKVWSLRYMVHLIPLVIVCGGSLNLPGIFYGGSLFNGGHMVFWFAQYILVILSYGSLSSSGHRNTWFT